MAIAATRGLRRRTARTPGGSAGRRAEPEGDALRAGARRVAPLCALLAVTSCAGSAPPAEEPQPRPVKYVEVVAREGARTRTLPGFAKVRIRSELGFRVAGTVQRVHVEQGDPFEEGDLIAEMDPADFDIQVREIEASLAEAKAGRALADTEFLRLRRLYENGNVPQGDFDAALARQESARAGADAVEHRLERARRQSEYTRLRAPFAGVVATVRIREGESVQAGTPVVEVLTGEKPQVEVAVSETAIVDVRIGAPARVRLSAFPERTFPGRVTMLGVVPSEGVATYPVTIELEQSWEELAGPSGYPLLRPGMAVEAEMQFGGEGGAAYVVPAVAVAADREGTFVYVVESSGGGVGTAVRRAVETGRLAAAGLEVVSGLGAGDKVVTAGVNRIADGQPVRLIAEVR